MKDKILKLCRRLKKCTLNEIVALTEEQEDVVKKALVYLENDGCIKVSNDQIIFLNNKRSNVEQKNLNIMLTYISNEDIDNVIKGFCLEIVPNKLQHFVGVKYHCITEYYAKFRELIYKNQYNTLMKKFDEKPQKGRYRIFYGKYVFFYVYDDKVYLSENLLRASMEQTFSKKDIREFKVMYSYLSRIESHNSNEDYMYHRLAEYIWRRDSEFEDLYRDLKQKLLNIA